MNTGSYLKRRNRVIKIFIFLLSISLGISLILKVFNDNILFFFGPSDIITKNITPSLRKIRVGGLVKEGSIKNDIKNDFIEFIITDGKKELSVRYKGILPNLFRENQGTVASGYLRENYFEAKELLAKHDENYMPKEVAAALKSAGYLKTSKNINNE